MSTTTSAKPLREIDAATVRFKVEGVGKTGEKEAPEPSGKT
jgi:hypothetical protein